MAINIIPGTAELWLGNDRNPNDVGADVMAMDMGGNVLTKIADSPTTGVAFDGTNLWLSGSTGVLTKLAKIGLGVLQTFNTLTFANNTEDLAWDTKRECLWRIENDPATLVQIDPNSGNATDYPLDPNDLDQNLKGGYGITYDPGRDLLYISFGHLDPDPLTAGVVLKASPETRAILPFPNQQLFPTYGFPTGGLGFDSATDTLWVGDAAFVRHMTLAGGILAAVTRPIDPDRAGGFVDGLEFIGGSCVLDEAWTS